MDVPCGQHGPKMNWKEEVREKGREGKGASFQPLQPLQPLLPWGEGREGPQEAERVTPGELLHCMGGGTGTGRQCRVLGSDSHVRFEGGCLAWLSNYSHTTGS